jgi:hypothetical protein
VLCTAIINGYGIRDSNLELNPSAHIAYYSPSSFVELSMSELPLPTPPISVMDPNDRLWNMEEELTQNQLKTDMIEAALENILAKLDAPQGNENAMYEDPSSRRAELAEELENYGREAESGVLGKLSRVKPATPPDFDGDGGVLFRIGGEGGKLSGCLQIGTHSLHGWSGGAEHAELHEVQQLVSMKASFPSLFLATFPAVSYHPSRSSKSGAPSLSRETWF